MPDKRRHTITARARLILTGCCSIAGIFSATAADGSHTFGDVPPPSKFSGGPRYSETAPVVASPPPAAPAALVEETAPTNFPPPEPKPDLRPAAPPPAHAKITVSADSGWEGQVAFADARGRFVVLTFPLGRMPASDAVFGIYHHGVKTGEAKITGPQRDDTIAADLIQGNAETGDAARQE